MPDHDQIITLTIIIKHVAAVALQLFKGKSRIYKSHFGIWAFKIDFKSCLMH